MKKFRLLPGILIFVFLSMVVFGACTKDEDENVLEKKEFYNEMKKWYYWTEHIPDINPASYPSLRQLLEAIRYTPRDKWSMITEWDEYWAYINNSEYVGYGFGSRYDQNGKLRVIFVFNTVPMYTQGVRRGWIIKSINGVTITPGMDYSSLLGNNQAGVSNAFTFIKPDNQEVSMTFTKQVVTMNTVLHHEVIESDNKKIGYMVLNGFTGTTNEEIDLVFNEFKQKQVSELILDMRYNGGGLTSVAKKLSSMIGGESLNNKVFTKYIYNSQQSDYNKTEVFSNEPLGLDLNRLVTICTNSTASSSELVINGLRPYMNVHIVGDDTYGKPMGANILRFNTHWAMVPITFKTVNANNQGEYFDGLPADIYAADGIEYPFGDMKEPSLQQAMQFILTGAVVKGQSVRVPYKQPFEDEWSLRRIIGAH
jgi:carboxyl-terminal processing protease